MAKNRIFATATQFQAGVVAGALSGDPVLIGGDTNGTKGGVALTDRNATTHLATVQTNGAFDLTVKGVNAGGNVAVNEGDLIYYVAADTPKLSKKVAGVLFGVAIVNPERAADIAAATAGTALLASGATGTVCVKLL